MSSLSLIVNSFEIEFFLCCSILIQSLITKTLMLNIKTDFKVEINLDWIYLIIKISNL